MLARRVLGPLTVLALISSSARVADTSESLPNAALRAVLREATALSPSGVRTAKDGGVVAGCWDCPRCGYLWLYHFNERDDVFVGYLAPHQECISPYYCEGGHPDCSNGAPTQDLIDSVTLAGGDSLLTLLRRNPDRLVLVPARDAVLILGCRGVVEAQVPLAPYQLEALAGGY